MEETVWLVDGMNVVGTRPDGWWRDRPAAMRRLVAELAAWQRRTGERVVAVFDGQARADEDETDAGVVEVAFAGSGRDAADDEIVRRVEAAPSPSAVRVVTADARLAARVTALGASVEAPTAFRRRLDATPPPA